MKPHSHTQAHTLTTGELMAIQVLLVRTYQANRENEFMRWANVLQNLTGLEVQHDGSFRFVLQKPDA